MIYTMKMINTIFTKKVGEYIAQGYWFNTESMNCHQDEVCKVDLTNGDGIIRILLRRIFGYWESTMRLEIRRYEKPFKKWQTLWNDEGELLSERKWYGLDIEDVAMEDRDRFSDEKPVENN